MVSLASELACLYIFEGTLVVAFSVNEVAYRFSSVLE
jgi:hypothetical protein